jgi:hypothetical protein
LPRQGHDLNDAMFSQPPFFETEVSTNVFLYGPAQPSLVEGKTYAFLVTAFDPMGQMVFRNGGRSEVCSFIWGTYSTGITDVSTPMPQTPKLPDDFQMAPTTVISGRLYAKFPTSPYDPIDLDNLPKTPITIPTQPINPQQGGSQVSGGAISSNQLNFSYAGISYLANNVTENVNQHSVGYSFMTPDPNDLAAHGYLYDMGWSLLAKMNARKYVFDNTENLTYTKPLPNTRIRLVARYAYINGPDVFGVQHGEYGGVNPLTEGIDLKGAFRGDGNKYANVTLAETFTDDNGDYTFSFNHLFWTGPIMTTGVEHAPPNTVNQNPIGDIVGAVVFPGLDVQNVANAAIGMPVGSVNAGNQQQVMSLSGAIISETEFGYLCLKIEVVNQKFCSPDIDIFCHARR